MLLESKNEKELGVPMEKMTYANAKNDGIARKKEQEFINLDEENLNQENLKKFAMRRGDGLADFLSVKKSYYKLVSDVSYLIISSNYTNMSTVILNYF